MKSLHPYFLASALLISSSVLAEYHGNVSALHCTSISNDIARLQCYDNVYSDYRKAANAPGNWQISTKVSPIDDTVTTIAALKEEAARKRYFGGNTLVIRCQGDELSVLIYWKALLKVDDTTITSRVGSDVAETEKWAPSTDDKSTFYPRRERSLVDKLLNANRFVVMFAAGKDKGETSIFNVKGLDSAIEPMRSRCFPEPKSLTESLSDAIKNDPALGEDIEKFLMKERD